MVEIGRRRRKEEKERDREKENLETRFFESENLYNKPLNFYRAFDASPEAYNTTRTRRVCCRAEFEAAPSWMDGRRVDEWMKMGKVFLFPAGEEKF